MTHVAITLQSLLTLRGMSQVRLAELTEIDRPSISRYYNGKQALTSAMLVRIASHLANTDSERMELVIAYLKDELRELKDLGINESHILIRRMHGDASDFLMVPLKLRGIFASLLQVASDPESSDLRDLLASLAHIVTPQVASEEAGAGDAVEQELLRAAAERRGPTHPSVTPDKRDQTSLPSSHSEQAGTPA